MSTSSTATAPATWPRASVDGTARSAPLAAATWCVAYHLLTCSSSTMPTSATRPNQATLSLPCGTITAAATRGPSALPVFPPTWNSDCARPCWPPEAMRAMRDDSGWKIDEPVPTSAAASSTAAKLGE